MILDEFKRIGRDMFLSGLVSSHGGNMSIRLGDRIVIKRRGAQFGQLTENDIIETALYEDDSFSMLTSSETAVHREIYLKTDALAIIHAHPRIAIALSLIEDEIVPIDNEGSYLLHKIPVISSELASGPALASHVAESLKQYKIIMVRGHGCFATGQMLEEAYQWVSCLEEVCQIIYYSRTLGGQLKEFRRMADKYKNW
jgi:L-fuculose-phosphate aldolase